jgi:hypothetical protein
LVRSSRSLPAAGGRSGETPASRLDDQHRSSHVRPETKTGERLYARLSRIALDLDDLVLELAAAGLSFDEAEGMRVPAAHLALAIGWMEDAFSEAQTDHSQRQTYLAFHRELLVACCQARAEG